MWDISACSYLSTWPGSKGPGKISGKIPGNINIGELQKISLLATAHVIQKVLSTNYLMTPLSHSQGNWWFLGALSRVA